MPGQTHRANREIPGGGQTVEVGSRIWQKLQGTADAKNLKDQAVQQSELQGNRAHHPLWEGTDKQFDFSRKLSFICWKHLPKLPVWFLDNRGNHSSSGYSQQQQRQHWKGELEVLPRVPIKKRGKRVQGTCFGHKLFSEHQKPLLKGAGPFPSLYSKGNLAELENAGKTLQT